MHSPNLPPQNHSNRLLIATHNPGKLSEFGQLLGDVPYELITLKNLSISKEVDEYGTSFIKNAEIKSTVYAQMSGFLTLSEDSGLEVDALGGRPGIKSHQYGGLNTSDEEKNSGILKQLIDVPIADRTARFRSAICIASPNESIATVEETIEGFIMFSPKGTNGFGYDPIFLVPEFGKSLAEISSDLKNKISHRGKAAMKAGKILRGINA
tara:strand:+ start:531 stop:1160 length:630 start_codon:yes stop_codon:yes gene_type:complete